MIKFEFVSLDDVFDEVVEYIESHKEQMIEYGGLVDMDYETYRYAARIGQMMMITLRHDGKLVGFSLFHLSVNPRDKKMICAENHGVFTEKEYRKKFGMRMLVDEPNKFLPRIGVKEISYTNDDPAFGRLLVSKGAKLKTQIWSFDHGQ